MKKVINPLVRAAIKIVGALPFSVLYAVSDLMYVILYKIIGYRRTVVRQNLRSCFPHLCDKEIRSLEKESFRNLGDIVVESLKGFGMTNKELIERYRMVNPELLYPLAQNKRSHIMATAHISNWEWGAMAPVLQLPMPFVALYKPLSDPDMDKLIYKSRSRTGTILTSIYETRRVFEQYHDKGVVFAMAADQNPGNVKKAIWFNFLGRPTAFLNGIERYATQYNMPVVYADINRVKRGYYEITMKILSMDSAELPRGEVTRRYVKAVLNSIDRNPAHWLWSHKRWKMKPEKDTVVYDVD